MAESDSQVERAKAVLAMLERLSADSPYAHRASGLRGSILRCLETVESTPGGELPDWLSQLLEEGIAILESAAAELRGLD